MLLPIVSLCGVELTSFGKVEDLAIALCFEKEDNDEDDEELDEDDDDDDVVDESSLACVSFELSLPANSFPFSGCSVASNDSVFPANSFSFSSCSVASNDTVVVSCKQSVSVSFMGK